MNTEAIVHPSEILYDMLLQSPKDLLQITNYDLFKDIILNKKDLIEKDCEFLAKVFCTSKEYWINKQEQWDKVNSIHSINKPCPDASVQFTGQPKESIKRSEQVENKFKHYYGNGLETAR